MWILEIHENENIEDMKNRFTQKVTQMKLPPCFLSDKGPISATELQRKIKGIQRAISWSI